MFAHWTQSVTSISRMLAAAGVISTAIAGVVTYRRAKRREAAQWMHEVFQKFQLGTEFDQAKEIFDFRYRDVVEPLHAALVAGGNAATRPTEWRTCHLIDRLLNYLEHLVYLSDAGHAKWSDCRAYFGYWFGLVAAPDRGALRRYLVHFGYERLARLTRASKHEYLLLYGSLCKDQAPHTNLGLDRALQFVGVRCVPGHLYDLGDFPGLVAGDGRVRAELYRVVDAGILSKLDEFEEFDHTRPQGSLYRRTTMQVPRYRNRLARRIMRRRVVDAWIYVYNQSVAGKPLIRSLSWPDHLNRRGGGLATRTVGEPAA